MTQENSVEQVKKKRNIDLGNLIKIDPPHFFFIKNEIKIF